MLFRAKPEAKSRNLWNLQIQQEMSRPIDFAQGKLSLDMIQTESSRGLSLTPRLSPVLRGTRNQAVLTALSRARV